MKLNLILAILVFITSCSSKSEFPPLKMVEKVNIHKFMGDWYVIANIPTFLEKGAHNAIETYTWNEQEKYIDVMFRFNADAFDGAKKSISQKAFIYNKDTNAEWRIQLFWPLKFAYLIIDLADDYSYTVIGVPDRGYVWIMARTKTMDEKIYTEIITRLKKQNYDVSLIQKVPQQI